MSAKRNNRGSLAEFGPALLIFIVFIFVPLLDFGVLPIRYAIAYNGLNQFTHRLAMAEKMSDAEQMLKSERSLIRWLMSCGVEVTQARLDLRIVNKFNQEKQVVIPEPSPVPKEWQPDASDGPFFYYLVLTTDMKISPLFIMNLPWKGIPGLTSPCSINMATTAPWENLGRDPNAQIQPGADYPYYMNE
ncbi:MAG TPA: hypothetical protein V6C89_10830 [Drouetiella sp.]|jgi:hypothetical protein